MLFANRLDSQPKLGNREDVEDLFSFLKTIDFSILFCEKR